MDLFELAHHDYLVIVDYYSKSPEIIPLPDKTTHSVITGCKSVFSRSGFPDVVISDNGPCFSSKMFKDFSKMWKFCHVTSSPGFPQSNGQAENTVKTAKLLFKKALQSGNDPYLALLEFRNTPIEGLGLHSPSQPLNSHVLRSTLPACSRQSPKTKSSSKSRSVIIESQDGKHLTHNRRHTYVSKEANPPYIDSRDADVNDPEMDDMPHQADVAPLPPMSMPSKQILMHPFAVNLINMTLFK
jgi:hypothetical protein